MPLGRRTTTADVYADLRAFSLAFTPSSTFLPMKHTPQTCPKGVHARSWV